MTSPAHADVEPTPSPRPFQHRDRLRPSLGPLTFLQPTEPEPAVIPAPATSPEGPAQLAEDVEPSPSGDPWTSSEHPSSDVDPTSSGASSPADPAEAKRLLKLGKESAQATARKGVLITGAVAHRFGARTEDQQVVGLYLTDEEDAENIGDPLGSIVARRGGVAGKALSPDAQDAVSAAMGLANYVSKQIALLMTIANRGADQGPVDV